MGDNGMWTMWDDTWDNNVWDSDTQDNDMVDNVR